VAPRSARERDDWPERFAVVGGAPRCGTTSLSNFLAAHPEVCFSSVKETHFLLLNGLIDADEETLRQAIAEDYLPRYFAECAEGARLWAEGSVSFIYTPDAARQLLRLWPDTRFVISLRDPMEMLPSLHERNLYQGDETEEDFANAWRLTSRRARGEAIPRSCLDARLLRYDESARFGAHLERLFDAVGRERCHVILHEDILGCPEMVIAGLYRFLSLPDDGRRQLPSARGGRRYRSGVLQRLLKRPPRRLRGVFAGRHYRRRVKPLRTDRDRDGLFFEGLFRIRKRLLDLNTGPSHRAPLPVDLRHDIRECFFEDVERLSSLLGRDLSHWLAVEEADTATAASERARPTTVQA